MSQETLGVVNLEWTCKACGIRNPGDKKNCTSCGAPMGEQDQFELPAQQQLITDQAEIAKAERGPDVACPFCGARNTADAKSCSQCGGDLTGATAREKGRVLGAFQSGPVAETPCPYCSTPNPANATKCKNCGGVLRKSTTATPAQRPRSNLPLIIGGAVVVLLLAICGGLVFLSRQTTNVSAVVQAAQWQCSIEIQELRPVSHENWKDQIPSSAQSGTCTRKVRSTQVQPGGPDSEKVCGTPYVVDQGNAKGKVVQDCEYKIYDDWCNYTQNEWTVVDKQVTRGSDLNPRWPVLHLTGGQREGSRSADYQVTFASGNSRYTYKASSVPEFGKYVLGSAWQIKVSPFGAVTAVQAK